MIPTTAQVRERFPDWTGVEIAHYRRGVAIYLQDGEPEFEGRFHPYFLRGFADAMGEAAESTDWFSVIEDDWAIDERWWE